MYHTNGQVDNVLCSIKEKKNRVENELRICSVLDYESVIYAGPLRNLSSDRWTTNAIVLAEIIRYLRNLLSSIGIRIRYKTEIVTNKLYK